MRIIYNFSSVGSIVVHRPSIRDARSIVDVVKLNEYKIVICMAKQSINPGNGRADSSHFGGSFAAVRRQRIFSCGKPILVCPFVRIPS